eukprot:gene12353-14590_t
MNLSGNHDPDIDESELYFLILHYLKAGPCQGAAALLEKAQNLYMRELGFRITGLSGTASVEHHRTFLGHSNAVYCAVYDKTGGTIITGSDDKLVKVWSAETGLLQCTCRGHDDDVTDIVISQNNAVFVSASNDHTARVWGLNKPFLRGHPAGVLMGHTAAVTEAVFHPTLPWVLLTASEDGTTRLWDNTHAVLHLPESAPPEPTTGQRPGNRRSRMGARNLTARNARPQQEKRVMDIAMWSLDDRKVLCTINDFSLMIWTVDGDLLHTITDVHTADVHVLRVHPRDPRLAMTAGYDGRTTLFCIDTGVILKQFESFPRSEDGGEEERREVRLVDGCFSPSGSGLVVASMNGLFSLYGTGDTRRYRHAQADQFFVADYAPLVRDQRGNVLDQTTQQPPHLITGEGALLRDFNETPYPAVYQRAYQSGDFSHLPTDYEIRETPTPTVLVALDPSAAVAGAPAPAAAPAVQGAGWRTGVTNAGAPPGAQQPPVAVNAAGVQGAAEAARGHRMQPREPVMGPAGQRGPPAAAPAEDSEVEAELSDEDGEDSEYAGEGVEDGEEEEDEDDDEDASSSDGSSSDSEAKPQKRRRGAGSAVRRSQRSGAGQNRKFAVLSSEEEEEEGSGAKRYGLRNRRTSMMSSDEEEEMNARRRQKKRTPVRKSTRSKRTTAHRNFAIAGDDDSDEDDEDDEEEEAGPSRQAPKRGRKLDLKALSYGDDDALVTDGSDEDDDGGAGTSAPRKRRRIQSDSDEEPEQEADSSAEEGGARRLRGRTQGQDGSGSTRQGAAKDKGKASMASSKGKKKVSKGKPTSRNAGAQMRPKVAPTEQKRLDRMEEAYNWLLHVDSYWNDGFVPQMGEVVVYFAEGHAEHLDGKNDGRQNRPWQQLTGMRAVELCRVVQVEAYIAQDGTGTTALRITLRIVDEASPLRGGSFDVEWPHPTVTSGCGEFLVLATRYAAAWERWVAATAGEGGVVGQKYQAVWGPDIFQ